MIRKVAFTSLLTVLPCKAMVSGFMHDCARFTISHSLESCSAFMFSHSEFSLLVPNESICKNIKGKRRIHFSYSKNFVHYIKIDQGMGNEFMNIGYLLKLKRFGA